MSFWANMSPELLEEEYRRWREDPNAVAADRHLFFSGFHLGNSGETALSEDDALKESAVQSLITVMRCVHRS